MNLWIDGAGINAWFSGLPLPSHDDPWHTMHGALFFAGFLSIFGILSWRWICGAFYGAISHIYLDGWVHADMQPFIDTEPGDTIYLGAQAMPWPFALLVAQPSGSSYKLCLRAWASFEGGGRRPSHRKTCTL